MAGIPRHCCRDFTRARVGSEECSHGSNGLLAYLRHDYETAGRLRLGCGAWLSPHLQTSPTSGRCRTSCHFRCFSSLSSSCATHAGAISHVGALSAGRPASLRTQHPPGPFATYQGSAQVTGLLKERSQDYFLAATDVVLDGDFYCSEPLWPDCERGPSASVDCASAAACSTSNNSTGVLSSMSAAGAPSMVVTGVFDGHGGEMSARYAREAILSYIANDRQLHHSLGVADVEATALALRSTFRKVDGELLDLAAASASPSAADPSSPFSAAAAATTTAGGHAGIGTAAGDFHDGTTALVTIQLGGLLAVANAGDSRAVLCRQGQAVRLSRDHTPALRTERERIEAAGGQVVVARGAARVLVPLAGKKDVMQALSVSRSLGDPDFKASGLVIADPDVSLVPLQPGEDSFLIAASDGLWGRVGDQEAVDCVNEVLAEYAAMAAPHNSRAVAAKAAARRLLRLALDQGSVDDVTVVVCVFAWAP